MYCLMLILEGLLIMMGQHVRSEALFYYFRVEDQVPETHLLRLIDKHISFEFVREQLKDSYSETGRPSIDPELLLRILLIGYLYGITSERKLVEELRMHLAWRWFTGLGFDQETEATTTSRRCSTTFVRCPSRLKNRCGPAPTTADGSEMARFYRKSPPSSMGYNFGFALAPRSTSEVSHASTEQDRYCASN